MCAIANRMKTYLDIGYDAELAYHTAFEWEAHDFENAYDSIAEGHLSGLPGIEITRETKTETVDGQPIEYEEVAIYISDEVYTMEHIKWLMDIITKEV